MIEVIIVFILLLISFFSHSFWVSLFIFLVCIWLIVPALYSIIKGAPFIPSKKKAVNAVIDLAGEYNGKKIVELGTGDARILEALFLKNPDCELLGYEYSFPTYILAVLRLKIKKIQAIVKYGNFWNKEFENVDILVCFLFEGAMERIYQEIWPELKPGTLLISNLFILPGVKYSRKSDSVYLYIKR